MNFFKKIGLFFIFIVIFNKYAVAEVHTAETMCQVNTVVLLELYDAKQRGGEQEMMRVAKKFTDLGAPQGLVNTNIEALAQLPRIKDSNKRQKYIQKLRKDMFNNACPLAGQIYNSQNTSKPTKQPNVTHPSQSISSPKIKQKFKTNSELTADDIYEMCDRAHFYAAGIMRSRQDNYSYSQTMNYVRLQMIKDELEPESEKVFAFIADAAYKQPIVQGENAKKIAISQFSINMKNYFYDVSTR